MPPRGRTSLELFEAFEARHRLTQQLERFHQDYPLLLTPKRRRPPLRTESSGAARHPMARLGGDGRCFSYPFNLSGQPAASVPCGFTSQGLPVGFQLAGARHADVHLLKAATAYMDAYPTAHPAEPYRPR